MTSPSRAALACAAALALALSVLTVGELQTGERALAACDAAIAANDTGAAIARARDAASAFVPGSPYVRTGYARLEALARDAETRGDSRAAVLAWSAMRAAATATSSVFVSNDAWRALADDGIARSGSRAPVAASAAEVVPSEGVLRAALAQNDTPSPFAFLFLGAGALAFFAGAARLAVAVRDAASLRREKLALVATAAGLAGYVIASLRA